MTEKVKFSIVIPNWNGKKLLEENLPKVIEYSKGAEIIIIDDASTDESVSFLQGKYPEIKLIVHGKNKGFGDTCNDGVKEARGDIIVLLNTDVIPEKDFLKPLSGYFEDESIFAVGLGEKNGGPGWAVFENGTIDLVRRERLNDSSIAFWASGGQSAFSKSKWLALGGFDELYKPFYWEDIDLSYRAWKRGYKVMWEPEAKVLHKHEGGVINTNYSRDYVSYFSERNRLIFLLKNINDLQMTFAVVFWVMKRAIRPGLFKPFMAALIKLPEIINKRVKEGRDAKVSDKEIFARFRS